MKSAKLPVRYEITETGSVKKSLKQICSTVVSEGGHELRSVPKSIGNYTSRRITTPESLLSIRISPDYVDDIIVALHTIDMVASGNADRALYYKIVRNPTVPGPKTWLSISGSAVQYITDNDLTTGGTVIQSGYIASRSVFTVEGLNIRLGRTIGHVSDIITIIMAYMVNPNGLDAGATMTWYEI